MTKKCWFNVLIHLTQYMLYNEQYHCDYACKLIKIWYLKLLVSYKIFNDACNCSESRIRSFPLGYWVSDNTYNAEN